MIETLIDTFPALISHNKTLYTFTIMKNPGYYHCGYFLASFNLDTKLPTKEEFILKDSVDKDLEKCLKMLYSEIRPHL